ncbi:BamA/TamA family outer membrane protein [Vibrio sp. 188UL20-2]|uniref:BamA/TamA family outer membrane protein n=2 Tax=Vibrio ulleungensis TaxID=2807619 RepID=A0ABS2HF97_9VIBR|nr:BamA/TamA family outer membrane protein [Vibrio ulleungensis]
MGHHIAENATGFLPIPILITEPAVGYGGGIAGLFLHETDEEKKIRKEAALKAVDGGARLMPAAITVAGAAGTENGTWFAFAGHQHSWLKDKIRYMGGAGVGVANLDIYKSLTLPGFGGFEPIDKTLAFGTKTEGAVMMQQLQFRVGSTPLMLGVKQTASISTIETESSLINYLLEQTIGTETVTSGLGLLLDYDTRNNYFYPSAGYKVNAEYMVYDEALGSDHDYTNFNLEGEVYIPVADHWTLGFAGNYQKFNSDDVVVQPTLKPYVELRGISAYRYQGDEVQVVQTQLTYDIDSRWKVSGFYGIGRALDDGEQNHDELASGYGAGFRYQIARRYGLHIGADIAKSKEESAFYISIGSGF